MFVLTGELFVYFSGDVYDCCVNNCLVDYGVSFSVCEYRFVYVCGCGLLGF